MFPNFLEWAYGQWGNLAGYIYGTAVYYSSDPPKIQEETEEEDEDVSIDIKSEIDNGRESTEKDDEDGLVQGRDSVD